MLTKVSVLRLLIALLKERWCDIKSYDSYRRLFFHLYEFFKILILKLDTLFHINTTFLELCRGTLPQRVNYASYDFLCSKKMSDYQNTKVFPVLENSVMSS